MQIARGTIATDADGSRRATLLIPQGTSANLVMPNGAMQPIGTINIRATEYTVGQNGPKAMPAALPPTSGYTYAVELSADEAIAAGASSVAFNQPLYSYTENFLGFPIGTIVPSGYYDRVKAAWVPSSNGRVIRITAINGGVADVDTVGSGSLAPLMLSTAERQQLATLYGVDQQLWRVPVPHFTPWDYNWPFGPPGDAIRPQGDPEGDEPVDDPSCSAGSIIECESQVLGESISVTGTPYTINYRSNRVPGRVAARKLRIGLSGASVPGSLKRIELDVHVAGRSFKQVFASAIEQFTEFTWDGQDAYGRTVQGTQPATVSVGYVYDGVSRTPSQIDELNAFAQPGDTIIAGVGRAGDEVTLARTTQRALGTVATRAFGLGGWTLSGHQFYDPVSRALIEGSGRRRAALSTANIVGTTAGNGIFGYNGDNIPATQARLNVPTGIALAPDGSLYIADQNNRRVRRVSPTGIITTVVGNGVAQFSGDGGQATLARLIQPLDIAFAPDGSYYITDATRIRRVGTNGIITTVVGTGTGGFSGDGGPATLAQISSSRAIAVAADGSLYIADSFNKRIRRIGPDGIITTIAGTGSFNPFNGDGIPAVQANLSFPVGIAVAPDGSLYITDSLRIRRIGIDGIITTVAGTGSNQGFNGDGIPATQANISSATQVAVAPDGSVYFGEAVNPGSRIRRISPDGIITTVAGNGRPAGYNGDGRPATQSSFFYPEDIAVAPDGSVFVSDLNNHRIRRIAPALPGFASTDFAIPSGNGNLLYRFDATGRHLRTLNAQTGATLVEFTYDAGGRLASVIEKTGGIDNVTTIQHDANGHPTKIVGPYGQETTFAVDGNGFLSSVTNPAGEAIQLLNSADGLLQSLTDPRGKTSNFSYDTEGRLSLDADAADGTQNLARSATGGQFTVERTTALARVTSHKIEKLAGNFQKRTVTFPDATQSVIVDNIDGGVVTTTKADGTVSTATLGPEPRFAMQSPLATSLNIALPGGPTLAVSSARTATLATPGDPLSLSSQTDSTTYAGRSTTRAYTAANMTEVVTTPASRTRTIVTDSFGRLVQLQPAGLDPVTFEYDNRGRLASTTRGSGSGARTYTFAYNAQGYVQTVTDPLSRTLQLAYDAAGRVVSKTMPGGAVVGIDHDASGNVTSITPPGRPAHMLGYSNRDELTLLTPPAVAGTGPTNIAYNADRQRTTTSGPDNRSVTLAYDAGGRIASRTLATGGVPTGTDTLTYDAAGRVATIAGASGVGSTFAYAGPLLTGVTWTGVAPGSVTATYDTSFRVASQSVNGANTIAFSYDNDSLVTGVGDLSISRNAQTGLPTGSALGVISTTMGHNTFGELTTYAASANATPLYDVAYARDALGRVSQKTETIGGVTDTYVYTYNQSGQLTTVTRNGNPFESYGYDSNGNRTSATVNGVSVTGTYDNQDRLTAYDDATFTHGAAGERLTKTDGAQTTTYQYDQMGNLLGVALPGGTQIGYVVDGRNRRVGKRVNGTLVKGLLYSDALRPVAELNGAGAVVSRFVYARGFVPVYMIKGGVAHRIIADQLGSVRLVVNAVSGAIVQRIDYDTFGSVLQDTNPGFQPFGFAGGLYDPDTGLIRFGTRDYDAATGRWTAKDRIGFAAGDTNLYRYVANDPVNRIDPIGAPPTPIDEQLARLAQLLDEQTDVDIPIPGEGYTEAQAKTLKNEERLLNKIQRLLRIKSNAKVAPGAYSVAKKLPVVGTCIALIGLGSLEARAEENDRSIAEQFARDQLPVEKESIDQGIHTFVDSIVDFVKDAFENLKPEFRGF